jgi:hypothetical protein
MLGQRCKNPAGNNHYCYLHNENQIRVKRQVSNRQPPIKYIPKSPQEIDDLTKFYVRVISAFFFVLALLYGAATGDWDGVSRWNS